MSAGENHQRHRHDHGHHAHGLGAALAPHAGRGGSSLAWTLAMVLLYMIAEALGGYFAGSLALLADAGHMLSDAAALALSLFAARYATRPPTAQHTFGFYRMEILAAVANAALLLGICLWIAWEALFRLAQPHAVDGPMMLAIAAGGLLINLVALALLRRSRAQSLNVHGAYLHVLADTLGSVAAIAAGAMIWWRNWTWLDPLASLAIVLLIVRSSWRLMTEALAVLMEGVPRHLDVDQVQQALLALPGVRGVHDLHVWTISSGLDSLSAHVVVDPARAPESILHSVQQLLQQRFAIEHLTIQVEPEGFAERGNPV